MSGLPLRQRRLEGYVGGCSRSSDADFAVDVLPLQEGVQRVLASLSRPDSFRGESIAEECGIGS